MNDRSDISRLVRSWLLEDEHDSADHVLQNVLGLVDTTRQRRSWWPARRYADMNTYTKLALAAAAVVVVAVLGYNLIPRLGIVGPGATPAPSPALLARGDIVVRDWGQVELEATRDGSSVTGHMTVGLEAGDPADPSRGFVRVDLECAQTTERGLIKLGGHITAGAGHLLARNPQGTWAAIVLKPGSEVLAYVWTGQLISASPAASCLAYLGQEVSWVDPDRDEIVLHPITGTVQFGP